MNVDIDEIRRGLASSDPDEVQGAVEQIPCFPMEPWARALLEEVATTAGHPMRYEAMLKLNSFARPAQVFVTALTDADPQVRCAAYCSLAVRGRPEDWQRLIDGATDEAPSVREAVVGCLTEWLLGSEVDGRPPLLQRPPPRGEDPHLDATLERLNIAFEGVVRLEGPGETRDLAEVWLTRLREAEEERG